MNDLQAVGWYVLYYFGQAAWWLLVVLFVIGILIVILLPAYFILKAYLDKVLDVLAWVLHISIIVGGHILLISFVRDATLDTVPIWPVQIAAGCVVGAFIAFIMIGLYLPIALASEVEFKPAGGPNISLKEDLTGREMFVDWKDVQGNHVTVNMIVNKGGYVNGSTADSTARDVV